MRKWLHKEIIEAGCDEVGRGCLAGPVVAAAVVLPKKFRNPGLADSKTLSLSERLRLSKWIKLNATAYAVALATPKEIDEINILQASFLAMHRAVDQLSIPPEHLLVDGNRFKPYRDISHTCIVKGDNKLAPIAAAAILAKTYRDQLMQDLHAQYPFYGWKTNVGYPTTAHRRGIETYGACLHHRQSFQLLPRQLSLFDTPT